MGRELCSLTILMGMLMVPLRAAPAEPLFHDSHFHLTNYIQKGISIRDYLEIMGDAVGRSTLFGIPLQQMWVYGISGDEAPTYYLDTDSPLYYYSMTDAHIAEVYRSLGESERARFDPMITGFNPADMYAVDHIRRVLELYPGVFSGIGEFSVHKEFVTSKIAVGPPSLLNPALDRILEFAAETGLVVILHCDIDVPWHGETDGLAYDERLGALAREHPDTTIIWAHLGLGRVIRPPMASGGRAPPTDAPGLYLGMLRSALEDPTVSHVYFDLSWDELAKFILATPETTRETAGVINEYPNRFLFGTDVVAPPDKEHYFGIYHRYQPLWDLLTDENREAVLKGNYERLFDEGAARVRAWEAANVGRSRL